MFRNEDLDDDYGDCEEYISNLEEVEEESKSNFDNVEVGDYVAISMKQSTIQVK